ncbi:isoprenoid synthase domain-containing protein [Aspergillus bertholletiae]|uniref:Isoprenoid synthase domain-containing protein n=1 Tax=Aspergillus bertholletiae TaxID=1226010 RepID=A0A5N7B974_9EURO|nr:isoprenoid synthase domain-containing protein [Aspergillus bertholletiae]
MDATYERIRKRLIEEALDVDHPLMMQLIVAAQEYQAARINVGTIPSTFEQFIEKRRVHSGSHVVAKFTAISMDVDIDPTASVEHVTRPLEEAMALCNDYFSYAKEKGKRLQEGKALNAVAFLQQVKGISEAEALDFVKRKIISLEERHNTEFEGLMKNDMPSPSLQKYLEAFRMAAGGLHLFHSTSYRADEFANQLQTRVCDRGCSFTMQNYHELVKEQYGAPAFRQFFTQQLGREQSATSDTQSAIQMTETLADTIQRRCSGTAKSISNQVDLCENPEVLKSCVGHVKSNTVPMLLHHGVFLAKLFATSSCGQIASALEEAEFWSQTPENMDKYAASCPQSQYK